MGLPFSEKNGDVLYADWDGLHSVKYHTSWDWIMPVVRKIRDELSKKNRPSINHVCGGDGIEVDIHCALMTVDIAKTHTHVIEFIKWYNATPTK